MNAGRGAITPSQTTTPPKPHVAARATAGFTDPTTCLKLSQEPAVDLHVECGDQAIRLVREAHDREQLVVLGFAHALAARRGAVGSDAVAAAVTGAHRSEEHTSE